MGGEKLFCVTYFQKIWFENDLELNQTNMLKNIQNKHVANIPDNM